MCLFTNNCTPPPQLFALSPPSRLPPPPTPIPIPSLMTPTKIAPAGDMPGPTVKLGSWHEIVIAKSAIMTASPAITISHPAIRINTISTHAARVSAFAAWVVFCVRSKRFLLRCMAQRNSKI